jgi:hypothetical protein
MTPFLQVFRQISYAFLISRMCAAHPVRIIVLPDLMAVMFDEILKLIAVIILNLVITIWLT